MNKFLFFGQGTKGSAHSTSETQSLPIERNRKDFVSAESVAQVLILFKRLCARTGNIMRIPIRMLSQSFFLETEFGG